MTAILDRLSQWHEGRGALRMIVAACAAFALGHLIHLPGPYTAALTTIIVARLDTGGTLRASLQRMAATLLGAGLACLAAMARLYAVPEGVLLLATLIPLALLATHHPSFRAGMVAAIIVLSVPSRQGTAIAAALLRTSEVGLGVVIGTLVSIAVLPSRTGAVLRRDAAAALGKIGRLACDMLRRRALPEKQRKALDYAIRRDLRSLMETAGRAPQGEAALARLIANLNADIGFLRRELDQRNLSPALAETLAAFAIQFDAVAEGTGRALRGAAGQPDAAALRAALAQAIAALQAEQADGLIYLLRTLVGDLIRLGAVAAR
jgi:uncharacterized membrane protein YccC